MTIGKGRASGRKSIVSLLTISGLILGALLVGMEGAHPVTAQSATPVVRAAFYYPWFPGAWTQNGIYPYTKYTPSNGFYSSSDASVVKQQIAAMQYGHLDAGIISWWGQSSREDNVVPTDLAAAAGTGFKWALYYEQESTGDPSVAQIQSDLSYIKAKYASDPSYLTIAGKPVIFVYADANDGCGMATRWSQANATQGFYTVLKVFPGYTACADQPSSWHQYAPATTEDHQPGVSFSISPGFNKADETAPRLVRSLTTWDQNVKDMVASNEPLQLVTTFNEWGEGTAVESATQWATPSGYGAYLDALHNDIPLTPPPVSPALRRYPYLSEVVGNSATLNWGTDRSQTTATATWGTVANGTCTPSNQVTATSTAITVGSTSEYQWTARLVFPGPGTYCYRVQLGGADLLGTDPSPQVKTAVAPGTPFSFAVVGDFGGASIGEANVMSQIGASPARFVVSTGDSDNASGSDTDYGDLTQGNVFPSSYLPKIGSRPIFAAQGNHGFTTNLPYLQNFPAPLAAQASGGRNLQESYCCISTMSGAQNYASSWYAFDSGGARFYVLEAAWADGTGGYQGDFLAHWNGAVSGCGPCGAELTWLKSDLAAHASTPIKFAFFHYPLHADSSSQGSDTYLDGANGLEGLLANNGVDIVFNGHAHQYERNLPQIPGKPLVSYVTGAGGAALGSVSGCSSFDAYAIGTGSSCNAPKPTSDAHVYEFLLVTVNGNQVTVTPTDSTGQVFDQQTYTISGSPPSNDFSISASPTSGSVAAGSPTSTTINTAVTSGVAQSVALSATGLPTGSSASFTPSTVNSGASSTMNVTTAITTPVGSYPITVTGTGSSATHSTTFTLTVTGSTGTAPQLVQSAGSSTKTVTLQAPSKGGDLLVLSAGVWTGVSQPITAVSDGKNTWTRVRATAVSGQYSDGEMWYAPNAAPVNSVTVTTGASAVALRLQEFSGVATTNPLDGSNGTAGHSTSASSGSVTPTGANDLAVGYIAGHASAQAITVTSPGYTLQPQQTTTSPNTVSVKSGYQVLANTAAQNFSGNFPATMYWSDGVALFKAGSSAPPPPSDFSITASPTSRSVAAGSPASTTINTAVTSGVAQSVALSATGLPTGFSASFTPSTVNSGANSTMTVSTASTTPVGSYPITVTGTGSSATHSTTFTLTVTAPPPNDFSISASPSSKSAVAGSAATSTINTAVTSGVAQSVALSATGTPAGSLVSFSPSTVNAGASSTMTITTGSGTAPGLYTVTVTGIGTSATHTTTFALTVTTPPTNDFSISASPASGTVVAGSPTSTTINTAVTSGVTQSVALSAAGAPSGSLVSFTPSTVNAGASSTMTITTGSGTTPGPYAVTVTGSGVSAVHTTTFTLTVTAPSGTTPKLVQTASGTETSSATSLSGSFPTATTNGHLLVLVGGRVHREHQHDHFDY